MYLHHSVKIGRWELLFTHPQKFPGTLKGRVCFYLNAGLCVFFAGLLEALKWLCISLFVVALFQFFGLVSAKAAAIPRAALAHKSTLIRTAHAFYGLDAPTSLFAAQIHQESGFNPDAVSPVGAKGMAQFMPATSKWIAGLYPHLADNQPANPAWAMRALVTYDKYLFDRVMAADNCNRWAKALSAYNGGLGWVQRDQKEAAAQGFDPALWWGNVEAVNAGRSAASWKENRGYPRRIMLQLAHMYHAAGWGPGVSCD